MTLYQLQIQFNVCVLPKVCSNQAMLIAFLKIIAVFLSTKNVLLPIDIVLVKSYLRGN